MSKVLCSICPRNCKTDRAGGELGFCKMSNNPTVSKACLHYGEEPCISGENGSGTVFFTGCSMQCVFCQNYEISFNKFGKEITIDRLAEIFFELEKDGAENINLVTPSHYVNSIIKALNIYKPNIPIVYNSSGYDSQESIKKLRKYIDIYLIDFKFFTSDRAERYSKASNYPSAAEKSILTAYENVGGECVFSNNGIMKKGIIVRHLIMPQGTNDAIKIIDWCNENVPNAVFSLMTQYLPMGIANQYKEINRKITNREYDKVTSCLENVNFPVIYTQDLTSATDEFIPDFNLSGV